MAEGPAGQIERAWLNVLEILKSAGMGASDLVKVTAYLTRREDVVLYREVRDRMLNGALPAHSLVLVAGLSRPELLVEIEATAAAA